MIEKMCIDSLLSKRLYLVWCSERVRLGRSSKDIVSLILDLRHGAGYSEMYGVRTDENMAILYHKKEM